MINFLCSICIKFHHSPLKFNAKDGIFCLLIRLILDVADHKNISFTKNTSKNTKNINEIKIEKWNEFYFALTRTKFWPRQLREPSENGKYVHGFTRLTGCCVSRSCSTMNRSGRNSSGWGTLTGSRCIEYVENWVKKKIQKLNLKISWLNQKKNRLKTLFKCWAQKFLFTSENNSSKMM